MNDFERHFKLKTHLRVIGTILESSEFYTERRKELYENLIIQSIQLINKEASPKEIIKVLQYNKAPLVNKGKLLAILRTLKEEGKINSVKRNNVEYFSFAGNNQDKKAPLQKELKKAYQRFVFNNSDRYFDFFQEVLVEVFSELGVNTVNHLFIKKQTYASSIEEVIDRKVDSIAQEDFQDFKEGILSFFESDLEEAKSIKISLAQAYTALRMMGVGNWKSDELDKILKDKVLVIDSNVLFSYLSAQEGDNNSILTILKDLREKKNVKFLMGHETKQEFFRAFNHQLQDLKNLYKKDINVLSFHENEAFDLDWFHLFIEFTEGKSPSSEIEAFYHFVENLIEALITELNCEMLYLDHIDIENYESEKEAKISAIIKEKSRKPKSKSALKHDCILWDYFEENPSHRLFTHDSIWRYIKVNKSTKSINAGDLFLYLTIGSYEARNFSKVLNHVIKGNLIQQTNLLTLEEIHSLANAEEKVLALPRSKRRELISKIHDLKRSKLDSGQPIVSNEISALAFSYLVSLDSDSAETNQVKYLETQLKDKTLKLEESEKKNANLENKLENSSQEVSRFKTDKLYIIGSFIGLIVFSVTAHYLHRNLGISWMPLSIPIGLIAFYLVIGMIKGFEKSWTIITTIAALAFTILPAIEFKSKPIAEAKEAKVKDEVKLKASALKKPVIEKEKK